MSERQTVHAHIAKKPFIMLALAISLGFPGIGAFCWLTFVAAIYALPFAVGVAVFLYTQQAGAGTPGAILLGFPPAHSS